LPRGQTSPRPSKLARPLPLLAAEAAKLDHATLARVPHIEERLAQAKDALGGTTDRIARAFLEQTIHEYQSALDQLRYGPYGDDPKLLTQHQQLPSLGGPTPETPRKGRRP